MFKKRLNRFALVAALVTTLLGLMAPAVGQAAGPTGTGPNDAMAPTGTMEHLNVGQSRWYAFASAGKDKNGDPSHVLVTLYAQPDGSAGFNIWTRERLAEHAAASNPNKDAPPIGEGTKMQVSSPDNPNTKYLFNGALVWAEGFEFPGGYLVEVYQTGSQPSDYTLSITGDAVTFPTSVTTSQSGQAGVPAVMAAAAGVPSGGTGPDDALAPSGSWQHLNVGQSRWYAFSSAGKDKNGDSPAHVLVTLYAQPDGSAGFNVWTKERLAEHAVAADPNKDAPPIGEGTKLQLTSTENPNIKYGFNGALVWAGGINEAGTYFVEVYQTGSQAGDYMLSITGDAVTFPASVTTSQPTQTTSIPAVQAAAAGVPSGGTGPSNPLAPSGNWQHLNVGQRRWYTFTSDRKDKNGDSPAHVLITLYAQPDGSAGFNVWTLERLAEHAVAADPNKDAPPIGAGTKLQLTSADNPNTKYGFNGALVWAGGINEAGKYLVEVYQTGSEPSDYMLSISGDAVTFP